MASSQGTVTVLAVDGAIVLHRGGPLLEVLLGELSWTIYVYLKSRIDFDLPSNRIDTTFGNNRLSPTSRLVSCSTVCLQRLLAPSRVGLSLRGPIVEVVDDVGDIGDFLLTAARSCSSTSSRRRSRLRS